MKNTQVLATDFCLFYGLPGTIIFIISILVAIKVGNDFNNDSLIRLGVMAIMNLLLWFIYLSLFIGVWHQLPFGNKFLKSNGNDPKEGISEHFKSPIPVIMEELNNDIITLSVNQSNELISMEPDPSNGDEESSDEVDSIPNEDSTSPFVEENESPNPISKIISNQYMQVLTAYESNRIQEKRKLVDSIMEYVCYIMPPFISAIELENLCEEIRRWCENPSYEPKEIELRERLSTNDLCHFIWNIGERLGRLNGYDGECRAKFVKNLFALALSDVEVTSLKNMTKTSSTDHIHLDRPNPNDNSFHYPTPTETKMKIKEPVSKVA